MPFNQLMELANLTRMELMAMIWGFALSICDKDESAANALIEMTIKIIKADRNDN